MGRLKLKENRLFCRRSPLMIPDNIKNVKGLKIFERCLLSQIHYLSAKKGYCFAKNNYFAEFFEISEGTVKRALKKLEDMNLIVRVQLGWGRRYIYVSLPEVKKEEKVMPDENIAESSSAERKPVRFSKEGFRFLQKLNQKPTVYHCAENEKKLSEAEAKESDLEFEKCMARWNELIGKSG